jgi:hypothetical protein
MDEVPDASGDAMGASDPGLTPGNDLDDDTPAPETGLHALGQLATAVIVVGAVVLTFLAVALALGWIFH